MHPVFFRPVGHTALSTHPDFNSINICYNQHSKLMIRMVKGKGFAVSSSEFFVGHATKGFFVAQKTDENTFQIQNFFSSYRYFFSSLLLEGFPFVK